MADWPYLLLDLGLGQEPVLLGAELVYHPCQTLLGRGKEGLLALKAARLGFHLAGAVPGRGSLCIQVAQLLLHIIHQHLRTAVIFKRCCSLRLHKVPSAMHTRQNYGSKPKPLPACH